MNAKLKRLHSPDIYNLENYQPECAGSFCFLLQAMIGPEGEEGEESFDIEVCTPAWIEKISGWTRFLLGNITLLSVTTIIKKLFFPLKNFYKAVRVKIGMKFQERYQG